MDERTTSTVSQEDLEKAFEVASESPEERSKREKNNSPSDRRRVRSEKRWLVFLIVGLVGFAGGVTCLLIAILGLKTEEKAISFPKLNINELDNNGIYSALTGEKLANEADKIAPVYCIQTPNGTDGARPQAGLTQAGVVFEAIAEAGITRFAAIYQNPTSPIIGPIRSLRIYYLQWDTPFDCTIVHAGGSGDALAAVSSGGYKDLTENYSYMYRGTYGSRLWNNLFTSANSLKKFSADRGYDKSEIKGFARMTPEESEKSQIDNLVASKLEIATPTRSNTSELVPKVTDISLRLGGWPNFNVDYKYDATSNSYLRSYGSGVRHDVYNCTDERTEGGNPEDYCELMQLSPKVVVAMIVKEKRASDNYHEDITAIGSGQAYIFQNGVAVKGTWHKDSTADQISFTDENGAEVKLAPGQTFITAVPDYGSVEY